MTRIPDDEGGDETRSFDSAGEGDAPTDRFPAAESWADEPATTQFPPADPHTSVIPPVEGGASSAGSAAWSQYDEAGGSPAGAAAGGAVTGGYPAGGMPAGDGPPPGDVPPPGGGGWDDGGWDEGGGDGDGGGIFTPWMIAATLLALLLVAGLVVWLATRGGDQSTEPTAGPTKSTVTVTASSTPRTTTPRPTTPTTTGPPSPAVRCSSGFVADEIGEGTTVRECDPQFLLVTLPGGETELYTWRDDRWVFLAAPASGVCREQLQQLGVPDRFRRVFQPCGVTTSPTTSSSTSSSETTPKSSSTSSTTTEPTGSVTSGEPTTSEQASANGPENGAGNGPGDAAADGAV